MSFLLSLGKNLRLGFKNMFKNLRFLKCIHFNDYLHFSKYFSRLWSTKRHIESKFWIPKQKHFFFYLQKKKTKFNFVNNGFYVNFTIFTKDSLMLFNLKLLSFNSKKQNTSKMSVYLMCYILSNY